MYLFKRFRSFIAENLESVGQRAAKLLTVKDEGLKKKSASLPGFDAWTRTNHSQSLMAGNFAAH